jgi:hypothetical protein
MSYASRSAGEIKSFDFNTTNSANKLIIGATFLISALLY